MNIVYKIELLLLKIVRHLYRLIHKHNQYNHTTIADDQVSNYIKKLLLNDKPCMVARFGSGEFDATCYSYIQGLSIINKYKLYIKGYSFYIRRTQKIEKQYLNALTLNAGFFPYKYKYMCKFSSLMLESAHYVDVLGVWLKENIFSKYLLNAEFCRMERLEP